MGLISTIIELFNPFEFIIEPSSCSLELLIDNSDESISSTSSLFVKSIPSKLIRSSKSGNAISRGLCEGSSSISCKLEHFCVKSIHSSGGFSFLCLNMCSKIISASLDHHIKSSFGISKHFLELHMVMIILVDRSL